ncbi:MAG: YebC/PmpR family DNA-binding transcriptional regulator [Anaerolineales bacterium]|nr:YebC/PmpR family DNA-binding transcriptional regulator [Anaerolineales bacterium]
MSGHSKWSTIKRKKGANDARRGAVFTRLAKEIAIAARDGGDPESNFNLRLAVDRAKTENMPKENIERAIKRGTGEDKDAAALEQITYEGYGPHGVAFIISTITDNRNRTVADLRHTLSKGGGSLGENGSVAWQFNRMSYFSFDLGKRDADEIFELAVEAGADDVTFDEDTVEIIGPMESFKEISQSLIAAGIRPDEAELRQIPTQEMNLTVDETVQVLKVIEKLEDLDDVTNVASNLNISDEAILQMEEA